MTMPILESTDDLSRVWDNGWMKEHRQVLADRDAWKRAALMLAVVDGYSHPRLAIKYAAMLDGASDAIRNELSYHWQRCTSDEKAIVRLVFRELHGADII